MLVSLNIAKVGVTVCVRFVKWLANA